MSIVLKRFEMDYNTMQTNKINDYFEFPLKFNIKNFTKYGAPKMGNEVVEEKKGDSDDNVNKQTAPEEVCPPESYFEYVLKGVVVHTGSVDRGHYYSYIQERQPNKRHNEMSQGEEETVNENDLKWFEFNDSIVRPFNVERLASECFGGVESSSASYFYSRRNDFMMEKSRSAYILFYDRVYKDKSVAPNATDAVATIPQGINVSPPVYDLFRSLWESNIASFRDRLSFDLNYGTFLAAFLRDSLKYCANDHMKHALARINDDFFLKASEALVDSEDEQEEEQEDDDNLDNIASAPSSPTLSPLLEGMRGVNALGDIPYAEVEFNRKELPPALSLPEAVPAGYQLPSQLPSTPMYTLSLKLALNYLWFVVAYSSAKDRLFDFVLLIRKHLNAYSFAGVKTCEYVLKNMLGSREKQVNEEWDRFFVGPLLPLAFHASSSSSGSKVVSDTTLLFEYLLGCPLSSVRRAIAMIVVQAVLTLSSEETERSHLLQAIQEEEKGDEFQIVVNAEANETKTFILPPNLSKVPLTKISEEELENVFKTDKSPSVLVPFLNLYVSYFRCLPENFFKSEVYLRCLSAFLNTSPLVAQYLATKQHLLSRLIDLFLENDSPFNAKPPAVKPTSASSEESEKDKSTETPSVRLNMNSVSTDAKGKRKPVSGSASGYYLSSSSSKPNFVKSWLPLVSKLVTMHQPMNAPGHNDPCPFLEGDKAFQLDTKDSPPTTAELRGGTSLPFTSCLSTLLFSPAFLTRILLYGTDKKNASHVFNILVHHMWNNFSFSTQVIDLMMKGIKHRDVEQCQSYYRLIRLIMKDTKADPIYVPRARYLLHRWIEAIREDSEKFYRATEFGLDWFLRVLKKLNNDLIFHLLSDHKQQLEWMCLWSHENEHPPEKSNSRMTLNKPTYRADDFSPLSASSSSGLTRSVAGRSIGGAQVYDFYTSLSSSATLRTSFNVEQRNKLLSSLYSGEGFSVDNADDESDGEATEQYNLYDIVSVFDTSISDWLLAHVIAVDKKKKRVRIHYDGYTSKWDEVLSFSSTRLRPSETTQTKEPQGACVGANGVTEENCGIKLKNFDDDDDDDDRVETGDDFEDLTRLDDDSEMVKLIRGYVEYSDLS